MTKRLLGQSMLIVVYASNAPLKVGAWRVESDSTAAGGAKMRHPNANAAKITNCERQPRQLLRSYLRRGSGTRLPAVDTRQGG